MEGGTTFFFVTDGLDAALARARTAAGARDVAIAGGASTVSQALRAGALDELYLHHVPILLGAGERLLDNLDRAVDGYECVELVGSAAVSHVVLRRK